MVTTVRKRDGRTEPFSKIKIVKAVWGAMEEVGCCNKKLAIDISNRIANKNKECLDVEEIQDMVEFELMKSSEKTTAKEYIKHRELRNRERKINNGMNKKIEDILLGKNVQNQNANVDENSFSGKKNESSNVLHKEISLEGFMRPEIANAHRESRIYIHDLSEYDIGSHNCLFVDVSKLLSEGFCTRNGDVRPANSFATACQLVAVILQCQSQVQYGGVASAHIDYDLAPYVRKSFDKHYIDGLKYINGFSDKELEKVRDSIINKATSISDEIYKSNEGAYLYAVDMLEREGKQAAQGLYHNLNTLESRAGSQVPFSSLNMGTDTSFEGRLVTKWILEASIDGIGRYNLTSIFPISIFKYKKGINDKPGTPNYDLRKLAEKSLSKRIYPNIVNCGFSQNKEEENNPDTEMATMGCRTMMGYDRHGMGYSKTGRGNVCPVTMNLPKIGIKHGICLGERTTPDIDGFWAELDEVLKITETSLVDRFYHVCNQSVNSAPFMYRNGTVADCEMANFRGVYEAMKHGTLAVGYIGIAEMCQAMFGKDQSEDKRVLEFALSVVKHIYDYCVDASERNNLNFSCYATPAENLCKTYASALREEFGEIKNVTDREYITNSHHVPVWQKVSIFKKLETEAPFCKYPTGGCITYIELESSIMNNTEAISNIIDYAMNLDIPYLAFNFPIDSCLKCGYHGEIEYNCPKCGNTNISRLRRVTGYLTTDYRNFNKGKIAEVLDRVKHSKYTSFADRDNT